MRDRRGGLVAVVLLVLGLTGCAGSSGGGGPEPSASGGSAMSITVTSAEFAEGDTVPAEFTCDGAGEFPAISWSGDPGGATSLAVVVDDPDAPGGTYYHLVVLDLPVATTSLAESFPADAVVALNSDGAPGWTPPCPPSGLHHYRFTVYGLSSPTGLTADTRPAAALAAIQAVAVAQGTLTGLVGS